MCSLAQVLKEPKNIYHLVQWICRSVICVSTQKINCWRFDARLHFLFPILDTIVTIRYCFVVYEFIVFSFLCLLPTGWRITILFSSGNDRSTGSGYNHRTVDRSWFFGPEHDYCLFYLRHHRLGTCRCVVLSEASRQLSGVQVRFEALPTNIQDVRIRRGWGQRWVFPAASRLQRGARHAEAGVESRW